MKNYVIMFLIIVIAALAVSSAVFYGLYMYEHNSKKNEIWANTPLPENTQAQVIASATEIKIKNKIQTSSGSVTQAQIIPVYPESNVTVNITDENKIEVSQKIWGFCVKPNISVFYADHIQCGFGARFVFIRLWGVSLGISQELAPYVMIDRRLRDVLPILANASIGIIVEQNAASVSFSVYL
jgi:hypothetical protein